MPMQQPIRNKMRWLKVGLYVWFTVVVFAAIVVVRLWLDAGQFWEAGQTLQQSGSFDQAVEQYEWAIKTYFPLNPYVARSAERLESLGQAALARAATAEARIAFQGLVSSLASVRHPLWGWEPTLEQAQQKLQWIETNLTTDSSVPKSPPDTPAGTTEIAP